MNLTDNFTDFPDGDPNCRPTLMPPKEFLELTAMGKEREFIESAEPFSVDRWNEADEPPHIIVGLDGRVHGHEGRHRAAAMIRAGISEMPVWVIIQDWEMIQMQAAGAIDLEELLDDERIFQMPEKFLPQREPNIC